MERLLLWIRRVTINRAVIALTASADSFHQQARQANDPKEAGRLRAEAEADADAKKELWSGGHRSALVHDHSVSRNSAPVQQTTVSTPKSARDLVLAVFLAASMLLNVYIWSKLHDAEKDIQTQVWLRDDALTKFEQGPYADLKAHVLALEIVCKKQ